MKNIHALMHHLHNPDLGILFLRLALGPVFIYSGWFKIASMETAIGFFKALGFAPFLAYFVAWSEFLGGIAFILGIFSRYAGILLAIIMAVAIKVLFHNGFSLANSGYEFALVLMLGSLAMVTLGSGKYSLKHIFRFEK
jgi:putative oxidoreductase